MRGARGASALRGTAGGARRGGRGGGGMCASGGGCVAAPRHFATSTMGKSPTALGLTVDGACSPFVSVFTRSLM